MCADFMPNKLVEKQIAIATITPTINNMILLANIKCVSIFMDTKSNSRVVCYEKNYSEL